VAIAGVAVRLSVGPESPGPASPVASTDAESVAAEGGSVESTRCQADASSAPFVIGEAPKPTDEDAGDDADELIAPFGVELGRAASYANGFAVGVLHEGEGGTVASVATLDPEGRGSLIRLARSRGDVEAPVVVGHGASLVAGMLEPNAGGRSLKIVRIQGKELTWGPELPQGRDESMAFDLAVGESDGVVVWDDVGGVDKRSRIMLATFNPTTMHAIAAPRPISQPKSDVDSPRVVPRPGGFWLGYLAHGDVTGAATPTPESEDEDNPQGEAMATTWLELVPLDVNGNPVSTPRRATPKEGHILSFDLLLGDDGAALVTYRDDDAPGGSGGGAVGVIAVQLGGIGQPHMVTDDGVGAGVPSLLTGWLAISSLTGPMRLAPLNGLGELTGPIEPEPAVGVGEPLLASSERLLVATPAGKAMRLGLLSCTALRESDGGR
jgi:hypothetical protein